MDGGKILPVILGFIFFGCMLGFVFLVKFPISCMPGPLKFIAVFFGKCDF